MREREKKCAYLLTFAILFSLPLTGFATVINLVDGNGDDSGWAMDVRSVDLGNRVFRPTVFDVDLQNGTMTLQIDKKFVGTVPNIGFNTIVVWFVKTSNTAVNTLILNDEEVQNRTDKGWYDYHMQLVNPLGDNGEATWFDPANTPGGDLFSHVYFSNYSGPANTKPITLNFDEGVVPQNETFKPGYNGVSGNPIVIQIDNSQFEVNDEFGFKQWPTVPEPVTLVTLFLGTLGMIWRKK